MVEESIINKYKKKEKKKIDFLVMVICVEILHLDLKDWTADQGRHYRKSTCGNTKDTKV